MPSPIAEANYHVIWSDDFSSGSLDTSKWDVRVEGPNGGNKEVQNYVDSINNVCVSDAQTLLIVPTKNSQEKWESARIEGKFSYACPPGRRILLQAELRLGTAPYENQSGIWPAFWALGESFRLDRNHNWPNCGEWDIVETAHGKHENLGSLHYEGPEQGGSHNPEAHVEVDTRKFHTYALKVNRSDDDWRKQRIEWYVDGKNWFFVTGNQVDDEDKWAVLAHRPYFPILNVAIGDGFPGSGYPDEHTESGLGSSLECKYVAFYESDYTGYPASLLQGQSLHVEQQLVSKNGQYILKAQEDGNVVVYNTSQKALWASDTHGKALNRVTMQSDGNLCAYPNRDNDDDAWSTHTDGKGVGPYVLTMQDDGNAVVYDGHNQALWASKDHPKS